MVRLDLLHFDCAQALKYARDRRMRVVRGRRTTPRVFNPRSRVSALSVVARGQGNTCVWLIVADREGARPRKTVMGKMANLLRFAPFRGELEIHQRQ